MIKFSLAFFLLTIVVMGQETRTDTIFRKQLNDYNAAFATAFITAKNDILLKAYTDESILMPEHSRQRTGKKAIADFYKQWLAKAKATSYQKTIFELQDLGNYILEIGNFTQNLNLESQSPFLYSGKYAVLWKKPSTTKQPLTIAAEIWGADSYFDDKNIPDIDDSSIPKIEEYSGAEKLASEVKERNNTIKKRVQNREGAEHAKMFMPDAMYLTYYTPILSGEKDITAYFTEHEKPGTLRIDQISILTSGIIYARTAIVEFGFYSVDWSDGDKNGNVKGKSINVWKKNQDGQLLLFRQMVNHD